MQTRFALSITAAYHSQGDKVTSLLLHIACMHARACVLLTLSSLCVVPVSRIRVQRPQHFYQPVGVMAGLRLSMVNVQPPKVRRHIHK